MRNKIIPGIISLLIILLSLQALALPAETGFEIKEEAKKAKETGFVTLDFKDIDLEVFIKFVAELTGKNIIVSPAVRGKVTVISPKPVPIKNVYDVFLSILRLNGFTAVKSGEFIKIIPIKEVRAELGKFVEGKVKVEPGDELVTQLIPLNYVDAKLAAEMVKVLLSPFGRLGIYPPTNTIVVSDSASVVSRVVRALEVIDSPEEERKLEVYKLKYAGANSLAKKLLNIIKEDKSQARFALNTAMVIADERTNSLILLGSQAQLERIKEILPELDSPAEAGSNLFNVYRLKNAKAEDVAKTLESIVKATTGKGADPQDTIIVSPSKETNSLIIMASPERYRMLLPLIQELDKPRKQVLIKALIAEVNLTRLEHRGIDWSTIGGIVESGVLYGASISMGEGGIPSEAISLAEERSATGIVYAIVNLLKKYNALNILSMPTLLCTENEEASLQVGQVIPQLKSAASSTENPTAINKIYEYKDTGIILKVTPHISGEETLRLDIKQVIEDVISPITSETPVTTKREINTSTVVKSGQTIMLGGLIQNSTKRVERRTPILGYIPLIGELFKTKITQREKVNLIIFLTPYIIEKPEDLQKLSQENLMEQEDVKRIEKWLQKHGAIKEK
ncbi:MAG: type II secretion system secretin GspD [Synergistetes bacterium]|nr:type II secretion system secretin GspD [Synergistota bacterium]